MSTHHPRRRTATVGLLLAALAAVAGCTSGSRMADPVGGPQSLRVDGRDRSYLLDPATGLAQGEKAALVVVLHQEGGTPEGVAEETELASLKEQGATLVYPAGIDASWDAGGCCGLPRREGVNDVDFLDALLEDVAERTPIDPARTALVGYSSGGMLTYRYVCDRPGALAAAVVVSGSLESPCEEQVSVPDVLTLHGKKDGTIGLEESPFIAALGLSPKPVSKTLRELTASAGCGSPVTTSEPGADVYRWSGCLGGSVVEAKLIADAGHGWLDLGASERTAAFLRDQLLS